MTDSSVENTTGLSARLAFSLNAYMRHPLAEALERIARIGYPAVEIMADVPHAWPAGLLPAQKEAIRNELNRYGLAISNINAFMMNAVADARQPYWHPSWLEPDPSYRRIRIDHTRRSLRLARDLQAPSISTEPGGPLAPGASWSVALHQFVEALKPVADDAVALDVDLLIEPEPGLLIETADQFLEFIGHLDCPRVGLNFDIGHFYCAGNDPASAVHRLAPHIRHVHLEDIAATRVHHHLIPGDGAIDFSAVLHALGAIHYAGWITVELYPYVDQPDDAARLARQRLLDLMAPA